MDRVYKILKIRPGEARTAIRFLAFMVVVWTGFSVGGAGVEALLFARFGPRALPYLYIALGGFSFLWMTGMTMLLRRRDPDRLLLSSRSPSPRWCSPCALWWRRGPASSIRCSGS